MWYEESVRYGILLVIDSVVLSVYKLNVQDKKICMTGQTDRKRDLIGNTLVCAFSFPTQNSKTLKDKTGSDKKGSFLCFNINTLKRFVVILFLVKFPIQRTLFSTCLEKKKEENRQAST